ncbi:MAG: type VI secretion system protein TssA [Planctomycetales bacterium]|nr:type VI secretion system protein TssA [Planctomycetales bacterium]
MPALEIDFEIEELLSEISPDSPCGDDLEYDAEFGEMERAAEAKSEQQFGDTIIAAEGPEWKEVRSKAKALFKRTRDLRVAVFFCQSQLALGGLLPFAASLRVLSGLIERYWDTVHPQLDPDDDNDPTIRVNTIAMLCDPETSLKVIRETPLVSSRTVGRFSYRDILIAKGELAAPEDSDESVPEMPIINAAFMDVELDDLQAHAAAVDEALEAVTKIENDVTDQVGAANAVSLGALRNDLKAFQEIYQEQLKRRGAGPTEASEDDGEYSEEDGPGTGGGVGGSDRGGRLAGEITCREDVITALEKATEYYQRYEPSSPLPLLLNRAKRLANADFLDILQDLAPAGLNQARHIGGVRDSTGSGDDGYAEATDGEEGDFV